MKSADVDIAITRNVVDEALLESLHALTRSEDRGNSSRNRRVASQQGIKVPVSRKGIGVDTLRMLGDIGHSSQILLRRRSRVGRTVKDCNSRSWVTRSHATTKEGRGRSRLISRVRRSAILEARDLLGGGIRALRHNPGTARRIGNVGVRDISREPAPCQIGCGEARIGGVGSLSVSVGRNAGGSVSCRVQELAISCGDVGVHDRGDRAVGTNCGSVNSKTAKLIGNSIHANVDGVLAREASQVGGSFMRVGELGSQIMLRNASVGGSHGALSGSRRSASFSSKVIFGSHGASRMIWHSHLDVYPEVSYDLQQVVGKGQRVKLS